METKNLYLKPPTILNTSMGFKVFYACKRGRGHVLSGKVCQDFCLVENISNDILVAVVADGHGGDAYVKSDVGSKKACEVLLELTKEYLKFGGKFTLMDKLKSPKFKEELIDRWQNAVLTDYKAENPEIKETEGQIIRKYGTTLLFAVLTKENIVLGQLGDGAILLFNDNQQSQIFKRHDQKMTSQTSSMASGRGLYAFIVESYPRTKFKFNNFILSTDGIYDKLDKNDSFQLYANALVRQVREKTSANLIEPFTVEGIDVSEKTSDDCTVVEIVSGPSDGMYELPKMEAKGCNNLKFERTHGSIEIYSAYKNGSKIEIHHPEHKFLVKNNYNFDGFKNWISLLTPEKDITNIYVNLKYVHAYKVPDNLVRIQELIEHGEHLEKKYNVNETDKSLTKIEYTNNFWLRLYETILSLKKSFAVKNYFIEDHFFKTLLMSSSGQLYTFQDSLSRSKEHNELAFANFESQFSFLGKIQCGEKVLPLFKCPKYTQGQPVPKLHDAADEKPLCRVVYNVNKKIYGLQNLSKSSWYLDDKEIAPSKVLGLEGSQTFKIRLDETEKRSETAEIENGFAIYRLILFV